MPKGKKKEYNPNNLDLALKEAGETGKVREIARKYGIPKSTLHFKIKNPDHRASFGPPPVLNIEEEKLLELWIKEVMRKGFPLKITDLKQSVHKFLVQNPRPNVFKENYPGDGWIRGFLKRHPNIVERTSEGVTQSSACVSESDIRKWFAEIHQYLTENNLLNILYDPTRVYNGDESGFQLCPKTGKVLAKKGAKNVYHIDSNNSKESITVMFTFSAAGEACPPMVVYNYQRIPQKIVDGVPSEWGIGRSDNGWMTAELFFEYIANVFHPYLLRTGVQLPVLYFLDGHKSHLTYEISKLCKELSIEVIALYPNATRILQPADVAVFRPVKAAWKDATRLWHTENQGESITKVNFASVLEIALKQSIKPETLINGFRTCGLVPFNPDAINYSKCLAGNSQDEPDSARLEVISPNSQNFLTLTKFKEIVGESKLQEIRACKDVSGEDENLKILYKLYSVFNANHSQIESLSIASTSVVENIVPELSPTTNPQSGDNLDRLTHEQDDQMEQIIYGADEYLDVQPNFSAIEVTPVKQVMTSQTKDKENIPKNSPAFKVISNSVLGNFLTLPKTPERKGKRNTIKMPFAITSDKYRAMFQEQKQKKELELKAKEEKKKAREESKQNKKQNDKKEKGKTSTNIKLQDISTNACKMCKKSTKTSNRLVCDMCSSIFHVKCIPKKHQIHVPEDIEIDLFVCHDCYKEDNNSDGDDLSLENNDEDDEDLDPTFLYNLMQQQRKSSTN